MNDINNITFDPTAPEIGNLPMMEREFTVEEVVQMVRVEVPVA
ncbi:MAG: hypothetical protein WBM32_07390 [Crocosphaera sp.]